MKSTTTEQAARAQTAMGVPPNESLSQGNEESQDVFLNVPVQRNRTGSTSSVGSNASFLSAFSNETIARNDVAHKERIAISEKRAKQMELFPLIEEQLDKMMQVCETQKNVSMTIKLGLKEVRKLVHQMRSIHQDVEKLEAVYERHVEWDEKARADRRLIRERVQAKMIRDTVLACNQKRDRGQLEESPDKKETKKQKRKTNNEADRDDQRNEGLGNHGITSKKVLVKVIQGQTYASVLGKIRREVNPDASNTKVLSARRTQKGDLLLRIDQNSDKGTFVGALQNIVKEAAVVKCRGPRSTVEIRDLDELTEEQELKNALRGILQTPDEGRSILLLGPNSAGLKMAVVTMEEDEARILLSLGSIKIGFTNCRIRRRVTVLKCYRCQEFGHLSRNCTGEDRSKLCYKCGGQGHKKKECQRGAHCPLCEKAGVAERNHIAGSGKCSVFRTILEAEKTKARMKR
jgi:hypothetical protein